MDIYDESMIFLEEIIEDNKKEVEDLLNKQNDIHLYFNIPIKKVAEGLESIFTWLKNDEIIGYCHYCVDIFKKDNKIQYNIIKLDKDGSNSVIKSINRQSIGIDNTNIPSKNKIESDLRCIIDTISKEFNETLKNQ